MKRALLLAGGGARGAFQVGMLQELVINQGMDFQVLRGVSAGALNAGFLAQAPMGPNSQTEFKKRVQGLTDLWLNDIQGNDSVYKKRLLGLFGIPFGANSVNSLKPLERLMQKHVSVQALVAAQRDFAVGNVSLVSGQYIECRPESFPNDFMKRFLASASIPVVFPYVDLESAQDALIDGGIRNITPLSTVFDSNPDEIYILLTSRIVRSTDKLPRSSVEEFQYKQWHDNWLGTKINGFDVLTRTLDIQSDEVYLDDIRTAVEWNDVAKAIEDLSQVVGMAPPAVAAKIQAVQAAMTKVDKQHVPIYVLAPRVWFDEGAEVGDQNLSTKFSPDLISKAIEHGKTVAADKNLWVWPPI